MARTRLHLLVKAVFGIAFLFFRISCHAQNWSHNGQPVSLKRNLQIDWLSTWMSHCQAISILKKKEKSMFNIFQYDQPYSKFAQMIPNQSLLSWRFYDILRLLNQHYSYLRAWGSMLSYKQHICKCLSTNFGFTNTRKKNLCTDAAAQLENHHWGKNIYHTID